MDVIVRFENTNNITRFMSQVGAFLEEKHIPPSKTKLITELHFEHLNKAEGEAVIAEYGKLPAVLGVAIDATPDFARGGLIDNTTISTPKTKTSK